MNVPIRRAAPADLDALARLASLFAAEQALFDRRLAYADDAPVRQRNTLRALLESSTAAIFVAEKSGQLVGYQSAEHWYAAPLYAGGREVYLLELFVEAGARRRGVGTALARAALAWAEGEGACRVRTDVLSRNAASLRLWAGLGAAPFSQTLTLELAPPPAPASPAGPLGFAW